MEKVANPSFEFRISESKSSSNSNDAVWFKKVMGFHRRENDLDRPFDGGGGGSETVGPASSSSRFGGEIFATSSTTNSQPFDNFAAAYSTTPYKSTEEMAASTAFPFTFAQWKELERQAMIYKYMISSVPVPPDLLFPLSRSYSVAALDHSASLYSARYSRNGDPEPGRCKRTDGKKWRCSRDVAPVQKYCERHLHRGRPRSRKHVEVKNNGENFKRTRIEQSHVPHSTASTQHFAAGNEKPLLLFNAKNDLNVSAAPSCNRDLSFMMEDTHQQLQHSIEGDMGFLDLGSSVYGTSFPFHQNYVEQLPLNVLSYSNFPALEIVSHTGFIDAWSLHNLECSNNGNAESSITKDYGNLSPSLNLSIAMAAGSVVGQEMGSIENCDEEGIKDSRYSNPVFWEPFTRGGPLAEALHLASFPLSGYKNVVSPLESISGPTTAVSSSTGVLHRPLFSHSDGSVCNSPTTAVPNAEIGFLQLNQS